ncbi:MAG: biotin/lipoate A/B protein ligase family protein [Candidatus Manganitrophus sp.]|nr:biotin/lipoate A/B protein ligase family protein [Candidatus Manganitrophus sp.]
MNQKVKWRLLSHPPQPPDINMAVDEAIATAFSKGQVPPTLRLYGWSVPSVSFGSFQKWEPGWDDLTSSGSFHFVRRITGGRALLHNREITYSVVASTKDPLFSEGIKGTFYTIAEGLLAGLKSLGVAAEIYAPPRSSRLDRPSNPLCFASTSWYEITARGRKLIGSAQRRWTKHFLQHGSLILEKGPDPTFSSGNQISLRELLSDLPADERLRTALQNGFESALSITLEGGSLTAEEEAQSARLVKEKYGNAAWTLRRETS